MFGGSRDKETPELSSLSIQHAEPHREARKGNQATENIVLVYLGFGLRDTLQAFQNSRVIGARGVNVPHDRLVAFDQNCGIHLRHKVQRQVCIVSGTLSQQSPLALQTPPELRVRER